MAAVAMSRFSRGIDGVCWSRVALALLLLVGPGACSLARDLDELEASSAAPDGGRSDAREASSAACPAEMVEERFADGTRFCIDRTEVTQQAYATFLTQDAGASPPGCATNTSLRPDEPAADVKCSALFDPATNGTMPVVCVDHCDAATYCSSRGARLCGGKGGGNLDPADTNNPSSDEWFVACAGTGRSFAPGDDPAGCAVGQAVPDPAASATCATPEGVQHLSGNVAEWTGTCGVDTGGEARCLQRGGSIADTAAKDLRCARAAGEGIRLRTARLGFIGFRCCSDL